MLYDEAYEISLPERDYIYIDADGSQYSKYYLRDFPDLGITVRVLALAGRNCDLRPDSQSLTIDLQIYPKKARKEIKFHPGRMRIVLRGDSLSIDKHRVVCSRKLDRCSYLSSFRIRTEGSEEGSQHRGSRTCAFDLDRVLTYRNQWIELGVISGELPE